MCAVAIKKKSNSQAELRTPYVILITILFTLFYWYPCYWEGAWNANTYTHPLQCLLWPFVVVLGACWYLWRGQNMKNGTGKSCMRCPPRSRTLLYFEQPVFLLCDLMLLFDITSLYCWSMYLCSPMPCITQASSFLNSNIGITFTAHNTSLSMSLKVFHCVNAFFKICLP